MSSIVQFDETMTKLNVTLYGTIEKISDTLSKCRVRIFYKGINRNRTFITEEFANQLIDSLPYAPVKGIFNEDNDDYEDHGDENSDGKIYGVVASEPNFKWEKHLDEDGIEREYGCADVILFTSLYSEANMICGKSQSMELYSKTLEGEWIIGEDGLPCFLFKKGCLLGLQILGGDVEPCFEGSAFFSLKELQSCINYIKNLNIKKDGEIMDISIFRLSDNEKADNLFCLLNPNFCEEGGWECDYLILDVYDNYAVCRDKKKNKCVRAYYSKDDTNNSVSLVGDLEDVFIVDVTQSEYTALMALQAVGGTYEKINENYTELQTQNAELTTSNEAFAAEKETYTKEKETLNEKIDTLTKENETFSATIAEKTKAIEEYEVKISELNNEKIRLENEKTDIMNENQNLSEFKHQIESEKKTAIIDEFSEYLTDEQINTFKAEMSNYSVKDFRKEVCTTAYDSDPTMFSKDSNLIFKGGNPEGSAHESGIIRILNKYKGGNK